VGEGVARQEELAEHVGAKRALHLQGTTGMDKITEHIKLLAVSKGPEEDPHMLREENMMCNKFQLVQRTCREVGATNRKLG
jgi:hypothetical protein